MASQCTKFEDSGLCRSRDFRGFKK